MEDMRELEFPALFPEPKDGEPGPKDAPTEEQLGAVDNLIDAMDMSAHHG